MSRRVALSVALGLVAALWCGTGRAQTPNPKPPEGAPAPAPPGADKPAEPQETAGEPKPEPSRLDGTVAIVALQIRGDAPPELKALLETSIRKGLEATGLRPIARAEVAAALADEPDLVDCVTTTCLQRIGEATGATHFLRASVEAVGAAYTLQLDLLSPGDEQNQERRLEESCPVCTLEEVSELLTRTATRLVTAEQLPVPVLIATRPQGADLRIDEQPVGIAPFEGRLAPGQHRVSALFPGHLESEQTIQVAAAGEPQRFEVILTKEPTAAPPPSRRRFRTWKWVAGSGAAAALITGIVLIAIDGDGTCSGGDRECPRHYDTIVPGILGVGVGIGLGGASGWMFMRDRADARPEKIGRRTLAITPRAGGVIGSLSLRF